MKNQKYMRMHTHRKREAGRGRDCECLVAGHTHETWYIDDINIYGFNLFVFKE